MSKQAATLCRVFFALLIGKVVALMSTSGEPEQPGIKAEALFSFSCGEGKSQYMN